VVEAQDGGGLPRSPAEQREFFIDNLLVRIHFIIVMIRWTGLAPWEVEFPFPGSLTSTFLCISAPQTLHQKPGMAFSSSLFSSLLLSSLELSDTKVYEPQIRALLETASHFCEVVVLKLRTVRPRGVYRVWGFRTAMTRF